MKAGWHYRKLGDVCQVIAGQSPEGKYYNNEMNGLAFYQGKKEFSDKFLGSSTTWTTDITKEAIDGDVLMSVRAPVGPVNFATQKICIGRGLAAIRATDAIDREFLFNFLLKHESELVGNTGAVFNSINKTQIENILIPLPPLPEQQRIVSILDEAFAGIATATANAEKNLANAREVYESIMNSAFTSSMKGQRVKLGDLITTLTDYHANGGYEVLKKNVELKDTEDYAWMVRSTDFEKDFQNDMRYISKSAYDFLSKSQILGGEIIMSKIGNAGKVYLMPEILRPCSLAMNLFLIRINENKTSNKFIYHYLKSKDGERQILSKLKGAATQTITKDSVRDISIPLFSRDMQERIVNKLELIRVETQALESIYQQKLVALTELKKSILNQAFSGNL